MVKQVVTLAIFFLVFEVKAQQTPLAPTPPMGFMTWNYFGVDFNEDDIKKFNKENKHIAHFIIATPNSMTKTY